MAQNNKHNELYKNHTYIFIECFIPFLAIPNHFYDFFRGTPRVTPGLPQVPDDPPKVVIHMNEGNH